MSSSWLKNMTTWFQTKRDQNRTSSSMNVNHNENAQNLSPKADNPLAKSVLDIMNKPDPKDYGPKRPNKP